MPRLSPAGRIKAGVAVLLTALMLLTAIPAQAENLLAHPTATQTQIGAAAIPASLSELLAEAANIDGVDYTSESYAAFKTVYDGTTDALENDPNLDEGSIAALEPPLQNALDALVSVTSLVVPEQNLIAAMSVYPYTFTGASYAELNRVLREITTARVSGTDSEIAALVVEAQTVIDAQVSRAALIDEQTWLNGIAEDDYTAWSRPLIQDMKRLADYGNLDDPLTYTDEDIAWALDWILNTKQVIVSIEPLVTAIDSADSISTEGMTTASVARFDAAVAALVQLRADAEDPDNWLWWEVIQAAIDEFNAAVGGLHSITPIVEAQTMLDTLVEGDYTSASWANIEAIKEILADIMASSAAGDLLPNDYILDQANEAHEMADALVSIRPLIDAIAGADSVTTDGMSASSVYWFHKEIQKLIALRDTENWITDEDIAKAIASYNDQVSSMVSLTPLVDALNTAADAMAALSADGYTGLSWNTAQAAIAQAKADLKLWSTDYNTVAWQSRIDWDIANMTSAISELMKTSVTVKLGGTPVTDGAVIPAGAQLHFEAEGLMPGSRFWVEMHSTPIELGSVIVGVDGKASLRASVPSDFAAGDHTLHVFSTEYGTLSVKDTAFAVTVTSTTPAADDLTDALARTGGSVDSFVVGGGLLLLLLGAGLRLVASRRQLSR